MKKKIGLNGYVYDFSVDYDAIAVGGILDSRSSLMEKNGIDKMFGIIEKAFISALAFTIIYCSQII